MKFDARMPSSNHKRTSDKKPCAKVTPEKRARTNKSEQIMVSRTPGLTALTKDLHKEGEDSDEDSEGEDSENENDPQARTSDANTNTGYSEGSLECLKGILQKHLLSKEEKKQLPLTKFTEQNQDRQKIIIGWEELRSSYRTSRFFSHLKTAAGSRPIIYLFIYFFEKTAC